MKRFSTLLITFSFLFAFSAMAIAIGGTYALKHQADSIAEQVGADLAELDAETEPPTLPEGYVLNEDTTPVALAPEDLGFTFSVPNEWGAFELTYTPGYFKGSGSYTGAFTTKDLHFAATDPTFVPGREGYYADILGYRKTPTGYEANLLNHLWDEIPSRFIQGEVPTKNGTVLVVSTDDQADGPSLFAGEKGARFAIINTPNGPVPGGVFVAGPEITRDEFRLFLESLETVSSQNTVTPDGSTPETQEEPVS